VLPAIGVSQGVLNFPDQPVGTKSAPQGLTITNDGTTSSVVDVNVVPSAFVAASDLCDGRTLAPGESCVLTVTFEPRQPIFHESVVTIHSQSGGVEAPPEVVTLAGGGTPGPGGTTRVTQQAEGPAISDDGRYVAAATTGTEAGESTSIDLYDHATQTTEHITNAGPGLISGPALSGSGRLVAFERLSPGEGSFNVPVQMALDQQTGLQHQVTGVPTDLPLQHGVDCSFVVEVARCGPALSGDGTALAYTAWIQPDSSVLTLSVVSEGAEPWTDYGRSPLVDFHPDAVLPDRKQVVVQTHRQITFSAEPTISGRDPDAFEVAATTCTGSVAAEEPCTIDIEFSGDGACGTTYLATLATHSADRLGAVPGYGHSGNHAPARPDPCARPL
jgi:Abnormal spindle-like microcephaly-assoc'd, ASPM-SPD-2-Hydin